MKTYVNLKNIEIAIMICLYITQKKLYKLRYEYKNIYKNIFIDKYKQSNIIKVYKIFWNKIKKLKLYIVKFNKNNIIKPKIYSSNYAI